MEHKIKKKKNHREQHEKGKFIRHIIFGAEDGLISTVGFLSGITGADLPQVAIVIAGITQVFAAAFSMGIGTYLSSKSQTEVVKRNIEQEKEEIEKTPRRERKEIEILYRKKGFTGKELKTIVERICSNKEVLLNEMTLSELGIIPGKFENALKSALVMFLSFTILAMIPLSPYLFLPIDTAIIISISLTAITLFIVGAVKTRLTKRNFIYSGLEMLLFGLVAAGITYIIGEFISTL